ncbi:MAG: signal peptidase I [Alphaproteobacteria bacterium]|nr:signal peptidase I [Alphaproteobacteria bacterium]
MSKHPSEKEHYSWNETIRTVILAVIIAMTFRSLAFEPFHIPSGSMKSNLLIGDYLFVSKFSYGYSRYSFPFGLDIFDGRVLEFNKPERGDVVVFRLPHNPRIDFIKRVMGLPGDSIQVREGIVYINGNPLPRTPVDIWEDVNSETGQTYQMPRVQETLPEGKDITILKMPYGRADNTRLFVVPEGKYFVMGDNRDNSTDSRFEEVGFVPEENIVGRAQMIFFSADETFSILNPLGWFSSLRFSRFFHVIR